MNPKANARRSAALLLAALLTGCGNTPEPELITQVQIVRQEPPDALLTCMKAPAVPNVPTNRALAAYMIELFEAHQDCIGKLIALNQWKENAP